MVPRFLSLKGISIRAPARGATGLQPAFQGQTVISIRAPARGATSRGSNCADGGQFQFAPPRGGRPPSIGVSLVFRIISIRAPARGATSAIRSALPAVLFQFAPPRGGRR